MFMKIKSRRLFGAASCAILVLGAAGLQSPAVAQSRITVAQATDVFTLDPSMDISSTGLNVLTNIFSALTGIKGDGNLEPLIAKSWVASPDALTWTFTLNEKAKFDDGTPVKPEGVVWTYEKIRNDPKSPARSYLALIKSIDAVDGNKVRFVLTKPFAIWDRQTSLISIMSKSAYERLGAEGYARKPVGAGPFRVVDWVKDDHLTLHAVEGHWLKTPQVKQLIFKPVPAEASRVAALQSGDVDVVAILPPSAVARLKDRPSVKVVSIASNRVMFLGMNVNNPVLSDIKLRQAIDYAIDREAISKQLLRGLGEPASQILAPSSFGYDPSRKATKYDPAKAIQLVKESGYKGQEITLSFGNGRVAFGDEVVQAIIGYLGTAGIKVKLDSQAFNSWLPAWLEKKMPALYVMSYGPSIMDAELALSTLYESGTGRGYWDSPQMDKLIAQQRAETDPAKRKKIIADIWKLSQDNLVLAPIYVDYHSYGMSSKVDWKPRPDGRLLFGDAEVR